MSSGTAALHAAMFAANLGPGDEVIVPAMTFVATANAAVFQGATPVFADVHPDTLLIDPDSVKQKITPRTRAIVTVDRTPAIEYEILNDLARRHGVTLIDDACHALGAWTREGKSGPWPTSRSSVSIRPSISPPEKAG